MWRVLWLTVMRLLRLAIRAALLWLTVVLLADWCRRGHRCCRRGLFIQWPFPLCETL